MQSLQARIDSFKKTKRIKRAKSSTSASVKWPHPPHFKANANTLAEAGFFFSPSWDDRDSVACFLCGKELGEWDTSDDPFEIHYTKCRSSCAWAAVRCGLAKDLDEDGSFVFADKARLPHTKAMQDARLATFGEDWWPHDDEPDHAATSFKMAHAGFVYTPQAAGDDTVTCLYCNLSLGGWEKQDDPIQEHRSRDSKSRSACPFLAFSSKPTRSKSVKTSRVEEREQQSSDELAAACAADDPRPTRAKRGKARSTTTTALSKSRRKTKTTRGKSVKSSTSISRRSQSPSGAVSEKREDLVFPDAPVDIDVLPKDAPEQDSTAVPPFDGDSQQPNSTIRPNGSTRSLPHERDSPSAPDPPARQTPLVTAPNHPDPIISLSPTGQPIVANPPLLTQDERTISLEQWIRQEIGLSSDKLLADGQRWIDSFKARAAEVRNCIDEL